MMNFRTLRIPNVNTVIRRFYFKIRKNGNFVFMNNNSGVIAVYEKKPPVCSVFSPTPLERVEKTEYQNLVQINSRILFEPESPQDIRAFQLLGIVNK